MKLMVICPILPNYRLDFYEGLRCNIGELVLFADSKAANGFNLNLRGEFKFQHVPTIWLLGKVYYQWGVLKGFFKENPDAIFMTQDFRAINFWLILVVAYLTRTPAYLHTQGVYNKETRRSYRLYRVMFRLIALLSTQLICYTRSVNEGLVRAGISIDKLEVMDNFLVNNHHVPTNQKEFSQSRALYVGRLRKASELPLLFAAMKLLRQKGRSFALEIVGDGEERDAIERQAKDAELEVNFHGAIYDNELISKISLPCAIGIYPGDAGLSVVHYMSLSLVTVVHSSLDRHMGPEPSYITHGKNGLTFKRGDAQSLADCLEEILSDKVKMKSIATKGYEFFLHMKTSSMEDKLAATIRNNGRC